jgi:hypothetical protein
VGARRPEALASEGPVTTPGRCGNCHAPSLHPRVSCILCGHEFRHIRDVAIHLSSVHGSVPTSRRHALLLDYARAQARGWPLEIPLEKLKREGHLGELQRFANEALA